MKKATIYHFTNESKINPRIYSLQIEKIRDFAASLGFEVDEVFCDMSIRKCDRYNFERLMKRAEDFDAIFIKDFYHLAKNTGACVKILKDLKNRGVSVYSLENGSFSWDEPPFDKNLRVATYICHHTDSEKMNSAFELENEILAFYVKKKTLWTIQDQFFDISELQKEGEQIQLQNLLRNKDKYDLILVQNLSSIAGRTSKFCRIREKLSLDMYSLDEGYFKYGG